MSLKTKWAGLGEMLLFDNWPRLIVDRTLFRSSLMIYEYKGMQLVADHAGGDAVGLRSVLVSDMYGQWLEKMTLPGEVRIADLGANVGAFPILLKAAGIRIGRGVCVEMNPNTFTRLDFNMRRNFPDRAVVCANCVISGQPGNLELYFGAGSTSDSIYDCSKESNGGLKSIVEVLTFDRLAGAYLPGEVIDICKVDIEGAEYDLFLSGPCSALDRVRYLLMEVHGVNRAGSRSQALIDNLHLRGFSEVGRSVTSEDCFVILLCGALDK